MAEPPIFLDGGGGPASSEDGNSSFWAPGLKARITVYSGEGHTFHERFVLGQNIPNAGTKAFFSAAEENECRIKKTVIIDVERNEERGGLPPRFIRFRSVTRPGMGSFIRVVHEKGHVTWHLPANKVWAGAASPSFDAGAWEFDIPHVEPAGEGARGVFGFLGRKIVTEVAFRFLEAGAEALIRHTAAITQNRRGLGLKQLCPELPDGTSPDFSPPEKMRGSKRILLLLHGTFSSVDGCFGELLNDRSFAQLRRRYAYVLGLEHDTLTVAPEYNAAQARAALLRLRARGKPRVDIISHSRGGLVARCLSEFGPVTSPLCKINDGLIERLVMIGTPNSGTPAAENAMGLINLMSNSTGYIPDEALRVFLFTVISAIKLIGHGIERLPGIQAQTPGSGFLRWLNGPGDGRGTRYSAASSDFTPDNYLAKLLKTAYGYALFRGVPNDLVVPCASVTACVPTQAFAHIWRYAGPEIHHCSFFGNPRTRLFLKQALA